MVGSSFHVAIIMDGNGRWAKTRGLPRVAGHQKGAESVRQAVRAAPGLGITHMTLFGLSTENWNRPQAEVSALIGLLRLYLRNEGANLHKNNVLVRFIGQKTHMPSDLQDMMAHLEALTAQNKGLALTVALSYGGRWDIVEAARVLARHVESGRLQADDVSEAQLSNALSTHGMPDPDLLIRTGGEQRLSNFLLWQCAYAELIFAETLWPDFNAESLTECVDHFGRRERRFGTVSV